MVTQDEHPATGRPFYFLHPCETSARMACLMEPSGTDRNEEEEVRGQHNGDACESPALELLAV